MRRLAPEAVYDSLYVVNFATPTGIDVTLSELTYFCYLSCLLSIYDTQPVGDWGYSFAATKSISPFSEGLDEAIQVLTEHGRLEGQGTSYRATRLGDEDLARFSTQRIFARRAQYLRAACHSTLAVPLPAVGSALTREPSLRRALAVSASRELLTDEVGPAALHRHFEHLARELPNSSDLFLASVTWIDMLSRELDPSKETLEKSPIDDVDVDEADGASLRIQQGDGGQ